MSRPRTVRTVELTVAGRLGPALRAAFADCRPRTVEAGTAIRISERRAADLADLVERLESAGVHVQDVVRLSRHDP